MRLLRLHDEPVYTLGEAVEIIEKLSWSIRPDGTLLRAATLRLEPYPLEVCTVLKYALKSPRFTVSFNRDYCDDFVVMTLVNTAPPLA